MGAFDDLWQDRPLSDQPATSSAKPRGAFADLWESQSPQEKVAANLPTTLNVAGFDTGIPLHQTLAKGLVMVGEGMDSVATGARQRFNELIGDKETARRIEQDTARKRELYEPMRETHPVASTVLGAAGQMAATAPLMLLPGGAAASATTRMANAATQEIGRAHV